MRRGSATALEGRSGEVRLLYPHVDDDGNARRPGTGEGVAERVTARHAKAPGAEALGEHGIVRVAVVHPEDPSTASTLIRLDGTIARIIEDDNDDPRAFADSRLQIREHGAHPPIAAQDDDAPLTVGELNA